MLTLTFKHKFLRLGCFIITLLLIVLSCKTQLVNKVNNPELIIAFGSCNNQELNNPLWDNIIAESPDVWIWGGDNIYADTYNMNLLEEMYAKQYKTSGYKTLRETTPILGTWDDHDYGLNDGGAEFSKRDESQTKFLNFLDVPQSDVRRNRQGVYTSKIIKHPEGTVKIIILDTRFFRTALIKSNKPNRRYEANTTGTILGEAQWKWLVAELNNSEADFNLVVTSIQLLSDDHGYERWGTFPRERQRLIDLIYTSKARGVIVLSGDRHISEFSKLTDSLQKYPLIDFTSSGLTHSYASFSGEPNNLRVGEVINQKSYGIVRLNFKTRTAKFIMKGDNNTSLQEITQSY